MFLPNSPHLAYNGVSVGIMGKYIGFGIDIIEFLK